MTRTHNFRELHIWQTSMELARAVYEFTSGLPAEEKYGLISQMRRCGISIPSNIAEGSGRTSEKEFLHFLKISLSSTYELETQLILSGQLFDSEIKQELKMITLLQKKIGAFIRTLNNSQKDSTSCSPEILLS